MWDLATLEAEYTLEGLKDAFEYNEARRAARAAARQARDAVGLQNAGELLLGEQSSRAQVIADRASRQQLGRGDPEPPA
ncbi:hypothetical protein [Streptomyces sp. NPDC017448]|uniref:hypothetical protein n=1 Tax=Streptomyces sp. NPDC017448 TaxID=3364996 RepID=UPI0037B86F93